MLAAVDRLDRHVGRPELRPDRAGAQAPDVRVQLGLIHREIHGVHATPFADGIGDVVVAVDQGDRSEDANRLGAVVLRARGRRGGRKERNDCDGGFDHGQQAGAACTSYQDYVVIPTSEAKVKIALVVNDEPTEVAFAPHKTLLEVLREDLALTGTKHGCELGECGTCTVLLNGTPVLSCLVLGLACAGHRVRTVEAMAQAGKLHPLQETFADLGAAQCGYCTPAFLLTAEALITENPKPTRDEIKEALAGNLCRCTGYIKIYEAVELAAARMRGEKAEPKKEALYGRP